MKEMHAIEYETFTEGTFWRAFIEDLGRSRCRVIIQSPFVTIRKVSALREPFAALTRKGVPVCVFVQKPLQWNEPTGELDAEALSRLNSMRSAVEILASIDVHVNFREKIHAKFAALDGVVLWEGSLNILSHNNTSERMLRWSNRKHIREAIRQHQLEACPSCAKCHFQYGLGTDTGNLNSTLAAKLGRQLANHRRYMNITQAEFAAKSGIWQGRVSEIECGRRDISLNRFLDTAEALDVEPVLVPKILVPSVMGLIHRTRSVWQRGQSKE